MAAVLSVFPALRWYVTSLMGDDAYAVYLAHHDAHHRGTPPVSEREFWRQRYADQDAHPGSRCC
ncbi:YbdD/YjiX family protein [Propionicicella superfundia]|uniref:YbdD/YjiX family protein n=1 Tax=Propionicicella superfundia TaxID=348582 RepID=UPI0009FF6A4B